MLYKSTYTLLTDNVEHLLFFTTWALVSHCRMLRFVGACVDDLIWKRFIIEQ